MKRQITSSLVECRLSREALQEAVERMAVALKPTETPLGGLRRMVPTMPRRRAS